MSKDPRDTPAAGLLPRKLLAATVLAASTLFSCATIAGSYDDALSAATLGDSRQLAGLLDRGIDPNTVDAQGNSLLILAAREGQLDTVETLLKYRPRIDYRNQAGDSALMLAALRGHDDVARALLKGGAAVNHEGWAPLHYAAFEGREGILDALVAAGADVNAPAPNKATALMLAARNGHAGVVRRLLALPQTDLNALNDVGLSADAWALQNKNTDIAELIAAERKRRGLRPPAMRVTIE
ncbi:ankyrin repeat domain-containing protein [Thauera sp. JM12B12]|uniref:ankyrin repeat domain-containing protein n=1 Tax=Thauera sp. JM12B12 TaxID=3142262 RepID=UPI0031F409F3